MDEETAFRIAGGEAVAHGWEAGAPTSTANEKGSGWEMLSASYDDCSIFPPKLHEGLHLSSDQALTLAPGPPPSQEPAISNVFPPCFPAKEKEEEELGLVWRSVSGSAKRMIGSWLKLIRSNILVSGGGRAEGVGIGFFSFAALVGMAGVFLYLRRRHRREKEFLLFLVQEKDQGQHLELTMPCLFDAYN